MRIKSLFSGRFFGAGYTVSFLFLLFFISLGFGRFYIDIGFALKPYMIIALVMLAYLIYGMFKGKISIVKPFVYEVAFLTFLCAIGLSYVYSQYPDQTFRLAANAAVIMSVYLTIRLLYSNFLNIESLSKVILKAGFVVAVSSLVYYMAGLFSLGFNFSGNGVESYGVLLDRNVPRLEGVASGDPNFSALIFSLFLAFAMLGRSGIITKVMLSIVIILTFSRGAFLALLATTLIFAVIPFRRSFNLKVIKGVLVYLAILVIGISLVHNFTSIDVIGTVTGRFDEAADDNGSGRLDKWQDAGQTFMQYPLFGIGANSSVSYNQDNYGLANYVHNTYIEVGSELGIVGFMVYALSILLALRSAYLCMRRGSSIPWTILILVLMQMLFLSMMTSEVYMIVLFIIFAYSVELGEGRMVHKGSIDKKRSNTARGEVVDESSQ